MPSGNPQSPTCLRGVVALGIGLGLFLPLSAADLYLSADRSGILPVNATIISFVALSAVFGLVFLAELAGDRGRRLCSLYLGAAPPLIAFSLLTLVQLSGSFLPTAYWYDTGRYIFLPLYNLVMLFFAVGIASSRVFQQHHRAILAGCMLGAAGSIFLDLIHPQTFGQHLFRPAGFDRNTNHSSMIVVILAIATVDWTRSRAADMLLWLVAGLAVAATLSRGSMILFVIAFLYSAIVSARSEPNRFRKNISLLLVAVPAAAGAYFATNLSATTYSSDNNRILVLQRMLEGDTAEVMQDSRVELAYKYIHLVSERPWLGY